MSIDIGMALLCFMFSFIRLCRWLTRLGLKLVLLPSFVVFWVLWHVFLPSCLEFLWNHSVSMLLVDRLGSPWSRDLIATFLGGGDGWKRFLYVCGGSPKADVLLFLPACCHPFKKSGINLGSSTLFPSISETCM